MIATAGEFSHRSWHAERLLQVSAGILVVLGSLLMGAGQRGPLLNFFSALAVCLAIYLADVRGLVRINRLTANILALLAVVGTMGDVFQQDSHGQLVAVANLQTSLQIILFLEPKRPRVFWQLILLSLGQVMVASALNHSLSFGALLALYVLVALFTLSLLAIYREAYRAQLGLVEAAPGGGFRAWMTRLGGGGSHARSGGSSIVLRGGATRLDVRTLRNGLLWQSLLIGLCSMVLALGIFFLLPRLGKPEWETGFSEPLRITGFTRSVTLGDLGQVVQNRDVVMRVRLFDPATKLFFAARGQPLFRGSMLSRYEEGGWSQSPRTHFHRYPRRSFAAVVRQYFSVEPLDDSILFSVAEPVEIHRDDRIHWSPGGRELMRHDEFVKERFDFVLGCTGIRQGTIVDWLPVAEPLPERERKELLQLPPTPAGGVDPLAGLRARAAEVLREAQISAHGREKQAQALLHYLRDSGQFRYSLESQERDVNLDPLEDFVVNLRPGHCEYFAGALALMLRSVGIPTRVAVGYKGGEWNSVGSYYQVRQLHAHAWVEAFIEGPVDRPPAEAGEPGAGGWLILDPTATDEEVENEASYALGMFDGLGQYVDYIQVLWANYIVGMSSQRQQESLYHPAAQAAARTVDKVRKSSTWRSVEGFWRSDVVVAFWAWYKLNWFNWRGGAAFLVVATTLLLGIRLIVLLARAVRFLWRGRPVAARGEREVVEFFRRLERALARYGLPRPAACTPFEHALASGGELAESVELRKFAGLPRRITEAFYRVRFGRHALDKNEADAVEHAVDELERALREHSRRRRK